MAQLVRDNIYGRVRGRLSRTEYGGSLSLLTVAASALKLSCSLEDEFAWHEIERVTIEDHAEIVVVGTDPLI